MNLFNKSLIAIFLIVLSGCTSHLDKAADMSGSADIICLYASDPYPYGAIQSFSFSDRTIVQRCTTKDGKPYWDTIATL